MVIMKMKYTLATILSVCGMLFPMLSLADTLPAIPPDNPGDVSEFVKTSGITYGDCPACSNPYLVHEVVSSSVPSYLVEGLQNQVLAKILLRSMSDDTYINGLTLKLSDGTNSSAADIDALRIYDEDNNQIGDTVYPADNDTDVTVNNMNFFVINSNNVPVPGVFSSSTRYLTVVVDLPEQITAGRLDIHIVGFARHCVNSGIQDIYNGWSNIYNHDNSIFTTVVDRFTPESVFAYVGSKEIVQYDEHMGYKIVDSSGRGHQASCFGTGCPAHIKGTRSDALYFDGVDDKVSVTDMAELSIGNDEFSLETRFNLAYTGLSAEKRWFTLLSKDKAFELAVSNSDRVRFVVFNTSGNQQILEVPADIIELNDGDGVTWPSYANHLVATYDGVYMKIYLNNRLIGSKSTTGRLAINTSNLVMGAGRYGFMKGIIDDVFIYNKNLTVGDVNFHYINFKPNFVYAPISMEVPFDNTFSAIKMSYNYTDIKGYCAASSACPSVGTGLYWKALYFDGKDDTLIVDHNSNMYVDNQFSVVTRFRPQAKSVGDKEAQVLVTKQRAYEIRIVNPKSRVLQGVLTDENGARYTISSPSGSYDNDAWNEVVFTYDGTAMKLYVNGALKASKNISISIERNRYPLTIGKINNGSYYYGAISLLNIYNEVISAESAAQSAKQMISSWEHDVLPDDSKMYLDYVNFSNVENNYAGKPFVNQNNNLSNVFCVGNQCPVQTESGKFGHSVRFSTSSNSLALNSNHYIKSPTEFSVEFWFNPDLPTVLDSSSQTLFSKNGSLDIRIANNKYRIVSVQFTADDGSKHRVSSAAGAFKWGEWNHLVFAKSKTGLVLFVNGVASDVLSLSGLMMANDTNFLFGQNASGGVKYSGSLDEFKYYLQPLEQVQVLELFNTNIPIIEKYEISPMLG